MHKPHQHTGDLALAIEAAKLAGRLVSAGYGKHQVVNQKGHGDLVSEVDIACDQAIHQAIQKAHPNDAILSEEISPQKALSNKRLWVVDPLDGTSAFLFRAGLDMPSIMIALVCGGKTQLSVTYFPLIDELFYAVRDLGAYKDNVRLHCNNAPIEEAWIDINQYADAQYESPEIQTLRQTLRAPGGARLVTSQPPHSGIGVRIAEGRKKISAVIHDNNPKKVKQAAWDVIPAMLILQEAGGIVTNFKNKLYDPFKPEPFIMASSASLAHSILACLKDS